MQTYVDTSHSQSGGQVFRTGRTARIIFALFITVVSAYLSALWFIWGVTAGKWIGLDSMAAQMERLNSRSRLAGYLALVLQFIAFWIFPPKHRQVGFPGSGRQGVLSYPGEPQIEALWRRAWELYGIRFAFIAVSTVSYLLLYFAVGWFSFMLGQRH